MGGDIVQMVVVLSVRPRLHTLSLRPRPNLVGRTFEPNGLYPLHHPLRVSGRWNSGAEDPAEVPGQRGLLLLWAGRRLGVDGVGAWKVFLGDKRWVYWGRLLDRLLHV